ncbi:4,5-DOPA dioxygenase extradiol [Helicobacter saguini]|uniref:4,5-DOPA dioxygenase extradiol n=2 Tax=Helicobacter saguini TaxID=1548018 RepID=A0A347VMN2_9HELI|nr:4,5-DOPA dioxygenase extradiol [Helicobacter saguini]MWV68033.1 4,5-DOPA dioxygenase extradiol [Helicobacter saguini]MWV70500.1 4,5-DOPA dioxygenase extradiol [Helicobacter saguini]MWV72404.1 4,5-DOPA dioxygenase extradiol [Helicobacter saguini]TLD91864.1 4,5-DOPA dioxygenase extradiol [Helicobacter saguini]
MPVIFVGHGSPMNALQNNKATQGLENLGKFLRQKFAPKAILGISAHYASDGLFINDSKNLRQIYDMYGFPRELYEIEYHVSGSPEIAHVSANVLSDFNIKIDNSWGLDHGLWSVLLRIYPHANIPVVPLSIDMSKDLAWHFALGRALQPLREQGVLIMASGNIVHNLSLLAWEKENFGYEWAIEFDKKIKTSVLNRDFESVLNYQKFRGSDKSFFTLEHFIPLIYALGSSLQGDKIKVFNEIYNYGAISMTSYIFGG